MFLAGCEALITPVVDVCTVVFGAARLTRLNAAQEIAAELQREAFCQVKVLMQAEIPVVETRPAQLTDPVVRRCHVA